MICVRILHSYSVIQLALNQPQMCSKLIRLEQGFGLFFFSYVIDVKCIFLTDDDG